jgi:hypothetical protein
MRTNVPVQLDELLVVVFSRVLYRFFYDDVNESSRRKEEFYAYHGSTVLGEFV